MGQLWPVSGFLWKEKFLGHFVIWFIHTYIGWGLDGALQLATSVSQYSSQRHSGSQKLLQILSLLALTSILSSLFFQMLLKSYFSYTEHKGWEWINSPFLTCTGTNRPTGLICIQYSKEVAGGHLWVRGYFPLYPMLIPSHTNGSTWICTNEFTRANLSRLYNTAMSGSWQ